MRVGLDSRFSEIHSSRDLGSFLGVLVNEVEREVTVLAAQVEHNPPLYGRQAQGLLVKATCPPRP